MNAPGGVDALADAFFGALEDGSAERANACFAPDARIWHNFDRRFLTVEENTRGLEVLFDRYPGRTYEEVRRQLTPAGFVQQHIFRLTRTDGVVIEWPGCLVAGVREGRIALLEEYVDLAVLSPG